MYMLWESCFDMKVQWKKIIGALINSADRQQIDNKHEMYT